MGGTDEDPDLASACGAVLAPFTVLTISVLTLVSSFSIRLFSRSTHPHPRLRYTDAEFAFDVRGQPLGFGLTGGLWGAGAGVPSPSGTTPQERAEVWFTRA